MSHLHRLLRMLGGILPLQVRLRWIKQLAICLIMPMSHLQLAGWEGSRKKQRDVVVEGSAMVRWVPTMLAMLNCLHTSGKWDPKQVNVLCWSWIAEITACKALFRVVCWMRSWPMPTPCSMWFRMQARCDRPLLATIATCSWSRPWTTSSWWSPQLWLRMVRCHVADGIAIQRTSCPTWLFSLSGGQWWPTSLLRGSMWRWSWRAICFSIWNWGAIALTMTCQCRSAMWQTPCCTRSKRSLSFPLSWSRSFKAGGWSPVHGK